GAALAAALRGGGAARAGRLGAARHAGRAPAGARARLSRGVGAQGAGGGTLVSPLPVSGIFSSGEMAAQPPPQRGDPTRFGKYTLIDRIAVGGMAEIFLARQAGLEGFEKTIVIKRIRPHLSKQTSFVKMFLNEAKLAAQLNHPNIVQIYDLGKIGE